MRREIWAAHVFLFSLHGGGESVVLCGRGSEESPWAKGDMQAIQRGLHVRFCEIEPVPSHPEGASAKGIKVGKGENIACCRLFRTTNRQSTNLAYY